MWIVCEYSQNRLHPHYSTIVIWWPTSPNYPCTLQPRFVLWCIINYNHFVNWATNDTQSVSTNYKKAWSFQQSKNLKSILIRYHDPVRCIYKCPHGPYALFITRLMFRQFAVFCILKLPHTLILVVTVNDRMLHIPRVQYMNSMFPFLKKQDSKSPYNVSQIFPSSLKIDSNTIRQSSFTRSPKYLGGPHCGTISLFSWCLHSDLY